MSAMCEDSAVTILENDLKPEVLTGLTKISFAQGCTPFDKPLRLIKTIEDFCHICIFPFITFQNDNAVSQSDSCVSNNFDQSQSDILSHKDLGANKWAMELQGVPFGILDGSAVVNFLGQQCFMFLNHLSDYNFRIALTIPNEIKISSVLLELEYDEDSFSRFFEFYKVNSFKVDGNIIPNKKGEHQSQSVRVQNQKEFIESIVDGIQALETHCKKQFGQNVSFDFLVHERSGLIYNLRVHDELDEGV